MPTDRFQPRADSIFLGAFVCITFLFTLSFLALALGFTTSSVGWGLGFSGVAMLASFFMGGWVTSKLNLAMTPITRWIEGICVWALASLLLIYISSVLASSTFRVVLNQMGLGAMTAVSLQTVADQIDKLNPRLETQIKLTEGKAVTQLHLGKGDDPVQAAKKAAKKQAAQVEQSAAAFEIKDDIKNTMTAMGWSLFALFTSALGASIAGVFVGARHRSGVV